MLRKVIYQGDDSFLHLSDAYDGDHKTELTVRLSICFADEVVHGLLYSLVLSWVRKVELALVPRLVAKHARPPTRLSVSPHQHHVADNIQSIQDTLHSTFQIKLHHTTLQDERA